MLPIRKRHPATHEILRMNWHFSPWHPSHWMATSIALIALTMPAIAQQASTNDQNIAAASRAMRVLVNADWRELFNGNDLAGWVGDTNGYEVLDGILVCKKGGRESLHGGRVLRFCV